MWEVMRDAYAEDPEVINSLGSNNSVQTQSLPLPGYTVDRDGICVCKSLNGERDDRNPGKWVFTANWSTRVEEGVGPQPGGDPSQNPEVIVPLKETLYEQVSISRAKDFTGTPYANGAGNLYDPPLQVDVELPRWDFTQFEPVYTGPAGFFATYASMSGAFANLVSADNFMGTIYPPGVYKNHGGSWVFFAPTDNTVLYFNGCINAVAFNGFAPFTLLLKVRSSRVGYFFGRLRRISEYSIVYDRQNHWDKPLNAGPFFIAPSIDENGDFTFGWDTFPYIYYTADEEGEDTDLVIDENGPLGSRDAKLQWGVDGFSYTGGTQPILNNNDDGMPRDGFEVVTTAEGRKTIRAIRDNSQKPYYHIEYVNHDILDFGQYLRIT